MSGAGWFITLGIIYLVLLVVFAVLSFRRGPLGAWPHRLHLPDPVDHRGDPARQVRTPLTRPALGSPPHLRQGDAG